MSTCISKKIQNQGLSKSLRIEEEETMLMQKQGIVTILGSNSLRRTLSADMSSKTWISQNELSPMKKTASSEELSHSKVIADSLSSSEGEDDYEEMKELEAEAEAEQERLQIWSSIQQDKKEQNEKPGQFDMWSSILSHKANDETSKLTTTPYIHPLVRRSKSCLGEKGLEICTESLGSETGSDGFSSNPPSESGDSEEKEEEEEVTVQQAHEEEELQVPKYNYATRKSLPRSFPPPLPSLSRQNGSSLQMRSHRDNGRLFLQAVSVPSQNNFCAQRQDGRLVLTFATYPQKDENHVAEEEEEEEENDDVKELEEEFVGYEEDDDDEAEEVETVRKQTQILSSGITSVHRRLALMMNKPIGLVNNGSKWSQNFNKVTKFKDVNGVQHSTLAQSLPRVPSTPTVASAFNAYEYYWRTKPTTKAAPVPNPFTTHQQNEEQPLLVLRGKNGGYLVHNLKSCKDSRRSFLFWESYCIAT